MILLKTELATITGGLRLSFGVVLNNEHENLQNSFDASIRKFEMKGSGYGVQTTLHPYITLDMSKELFKTKLEKNFSINFSGMNKYTLLKNMKFVMKSFASDVDVFYRMHGKLCVDIEKAKKYQIVSLGNNGKQIRFEPSLVEYQEEFFEGVLIAIGDYSNSIQVTFEEFEYMINVISNLQMQQLALQIVTLYYECVNSNSLNILQNRFGITVDKFVKNQSSFQYGLANKLDTLEHKLS
jgi:hypothetical protein